MIFRWARKIRAGFLVRFVAYQEVYNSYYWEAAEISVQHRVVECSRLRPAPSIQHWDAFAADRVSIVRRKRGTVQMIFQRAVMWIDVDTCPYVLIFSMGTKRNS
jgi:hypothetical protein